MDLLRRPTPLHHDLAYERHQKDRVLEGAEGEEVTEGVQGVVRVGSGSQ